MRANKDFGYVYHCDSAWLGLIRFEYGYVLQWAGNPNANTAQGVADGINAFSQLTGWDEDSMLTVSHEGASGGKCNYPV